MDYKDFERGVDEQNFWHKSRRNLIHALLSRIKKRNLKILCEGVGTGANLKVLNKFGSVYVIDVDSRALKLIPRKACYSKKRCDACDIKYKANFFDLAVAFDVLEHIENDAQAVSEIKRVLKKNGIFAFTVPAFQFMYGSHDKALGHKRRYSRKSIERLLSKFTKLDFGYWNFSLFLPVFFLRALKKKSSSTTDLVRLPKFINSLLFSLLNFEVFLIKKGIKMPFGVTVYGLYRK